ncbi:beta-galactosidase [Streptomyces atratus]|uniref:beta-galactosidase n=1 Tax=Streptomyces atratus TaxID=1893 RepID=UPI0037DA0BED
MGLNTIETCVPWNFHSPHPGELRLDAGLDLPQSLDLAAAEDLHVPLRPGPYICAEWEGGGLTSWLLADEATGAACRRPGDRRAGDGAGRRLRRERRGAAVASGRARAEGRLPYEPPRSMAAVAVSRSDVSHDTAQPVSPFGAEPDLWDTLGTRTPDLRPQSRSHP